MSGSIPDPERALVGALLLSQSTMDAADVLAYAGDVRPEHFRSTRVRQVWQAARRLAENGVVPDAVAVVHELGRDNGAPAFVAELLDGLPRVRNPAAWAELVRSNGHVREREPGEDDDEPVPVSRSRHQPGALFAPLPVAQLYNETSEAIDWLWHGFIPVGAFVLLAAFMKAGKSTLAYALLAAILAGRPFLDRDTRATRVLLLALEESARDVKRRLLKFGVARDAGLFLQFRPVPTTPSEWASLVEFIQAERIGLVVVDTLARCWPVWGVDNENDNARVAAALGPLLELCREENVTALLLHHTGKLTEGHGREVRGAGSILALADQALLFDRYRAGDPCDRVIRVLGRYDESPAETLIRYSNASGTYEVIHEEEHDQEARGAERLFPQVLAYLRRVGVTGASLRNVRANVTGSRNTVRDRAVELLVDQGKAILRDGRFYHEDYDPLEASK